MLAAALLDQITLRPPSKFVEQRTRPRNRARQRGDGDARRGASGAKRKRPSFPITPSDSLAKLRTRGGAAASAADPPTLVTVPPPADNQWCIALRTAREAGKLIDVTLLVGSRKIQAHKVALVGLSPYLNGLLTSGLAESTETGHEMAVGDESTDGRVSRRSWT